MAYEKHPDEVGVLFKKQSKAGTDYYTGTLAGQEVVGFVRVSANGSERIELKKSKPRDVQQQEPQQESVPAFADLGSSEAPF